MGPAAKRDDLTQESRKVYPARRRHSRGGGGFGWARSAHLRRRPSPLTWLALAPRSSIGPECQFVFADRSACGDASSPVTRPAARLASQISAGASGCIQLSTGAGDRLREVRVLQGGRRDEVNRAPEECLKIFLEAEVGIEAAHGCVIELDKEVDVAGRLVEMLGTGGAEQ